MNQAAQIGPAYTGGRLGLRLAGRLRFGSGRRAGSGSLLAGRLGFGSGNKASLGLLGSLGWMWPKGPRAFPPLSLLPGSLSLASGTGATARWLLLASGARVSVLSFLLPCFLPWLPPSPSFAQTAAGAAMVRLFFGGGGAEMAHGLSSLGGGGSSHGGSGWRGHVARQIQGARSELDGGGKQRERGGGRGPAAWRRELRRRRRGFGGDPRQGFLVTEHRGLARRRRGPAARPWPKGRARVRG